MSENDQADRTLNDDDIRTVGAATPNATTRDGDNDSTDPDTDGVDTTDTDGVDTTDTDSEDN
jgi:hypothetical protein